MIDSPAFLSVEYYDNTITAWLVAAGILIGGWLLLVAARRLLIARLERFAARTQTSIDDLALDGLRRTSGAFLFVVAFTAAVHVGLRLPPNVTRGAELLAKIAFLLQSASWGSGAITFWLQRVSSDPERHDAASITTLNVLGVVARIVLWALLALLALDAFGVNITALVTGLGIAGIAVALAVQNVLGDLLASLSIALDKPFVIGDTIHVDTFIGTVEHIGLKTTRLRSLSGELLVFSNADLLKTRIRNYRGSWDRRVVVTFGLTYDTTPDQAAHVPTMMREILADEPDVRLDRTHFSGLGDSALTFETVYYVAGGNDFAKHMDVKQRVLLALMRRIEEAGLSFAFPTQTVVLRAAPQGAPPPPNAPPPAE